MVYMAGKWLTYPGGPNHQAPLVVILFVLILILSSCNPRTEQIPYSDSAVDSAIKKKLILVDTLRIEVDSVTQVNHYFTQVKYLSSDTLYLIFNTNIMALQAYSLTTQQLVWQQQYPTSGPGEVDINSRFFYHNKDSVFFFTEYPYNSLKLFNNKGELRHSWVIRLPEPYSDFWVSLTMFGEFSYQANSVVFAVYPEISPSATTRFYQQGRLCSYNLRTNEYRFFARFPELFYATDALYYVFEYIEFYVRSGHLVTHFHPTGELSTYSLPDLKLKRKVYAPSWFIKKNTKPFMYRGEDEPDAQQENNYLMTEPYYAMMTANPEGTLHYRIVKLRTLLRYEDGTLRNFYDKPFSIMVLDSVFNIVDEVKFSGGLYDYYQVFAVADRLYISYNNPMNEANSESFMQFAVFKLTDIKP